MDGSHAADSTEQQSAAGQILSVLSASLDLPVMERARIDVGLDRPVEVDGALADPPVLVEVYARQSPPKGATKDKPVMAALKMKLIHDRAPEYRGARMVLALSGPMAAGLTGWRAAAIEDLGVEVRRVDLDDEAVRVLLAAQERQGRAGNVRRDLQ